MKQVFELMGAKGDAQMEELKIETNQWRTMDYEQDAQMYLQEIQMQLDPHRYIPCDPSGKFNDDCVVMFDA